MNKLLRFADCFVLLGAILGCLLRFWMRNSGIDSAGLYITSHPAWVMLCILSVGMVAFIWLITRHAGNSRSYSENFSKSITGAVTYILLALVLGYSGIMGLLTAPDFLAKLTAIVSMLSAITLAVAGIERYCGNQPVFFVHMIPCIYFALRLFDIGRTFGAEPELCSFLFTFLASLSLIPAYYWLWSFDVNLAKRKQSLFWSLIAAFFCLLATFDAETGWALYMLHAAVLLSNLCRLQPLYAEAKNVVAPAAEEVVRKAEPFMEEEDSMEEVPFEEEAAPEETPAMARDIPEEMPAMDEIPAQMPTMEEEIPEEEEVPTEMPPIEKPVAPAPVYRKPVLHADIDPEEDMDAFLEDIKLFLDSEDF